MELELDAAGKLDVDAIRAFIESHDDRDGAIWHMGPDQAYAITSLAYDIHVTVVPDDAPPSPPVECSKLFSDTFLGYPITIGWRATPGVLSFLRPGKATLDIINLPQPTI